MTNAFFCDPRASVVEVLRDGQAGRVYQDITGRSGARYVMCLYKYDPGATGTTNFLLDVPWFFNCLWQNNVTLPGADLARWGKLREKHTQGQRYLGHTSARA
mmetsp:Transcript_73407/g.201605  ORF Transcript_73407/g.201605 Transcript_73407/m.201605 type:complete len:102 (-) Transcript_73407:37-342(-)